MTAVFGLIIGFFFTLAALAGAGAIGAAGGGPARLGLIFGVGAIILIPIFYGIIGFIAGLIGAAIYNIAASIVGGVVIETRPTGGGNSP